MDYIWASVGVAVVAAPFNPPLLRPAYLQSRRVVPESWADVDRVEGSGQDFPRIVQYSNGYHFALSEEKLVFAQREPEEPVSMSLAPSMVRTFLETQRDALLEYRAVGVNLDIFLPMADHHAWILDTFATGGRTATLAPTQAVVGFVYPLEDAVRLNLTVKAVEQVDAAGPTKVAGVMLEANYDMHVEPNEEPSTTLAAVSRFEELCGHFEAFWPDVVGKTHG